MKDVIILSSLPGGGKSTWAEARSKEKPGKVVIVSADHFHMVGDKYEFKAENLPQAHAECKRSFINTLNRPYSEVEMVIVDNTNLTPVDVAFYYEYAALYHHKVQVVRFEVDPEVCFTRQIHGVSRRTFDQMYYLHVNAQWPPYWNVSAIREAGEVEAVIDGWKG